MATWENAMEAFAGESQANRKYQAFSEKAKEQNFKMVGKLFKAASEAEAIHAKRLANVLNLAGNTKENLESGIKGETHEYTSMYPAFVKEAQAEGNKDAETAFTYAMKAEEVHAKWYASALESVKGGKDIPAANVYLCPVCGNIEIGKAPGRCPICSVPGHMWRVIE
jgi:rubrerythrin